MVKTQEEPTPPQPPPQGPCPYPFFYPPYPAPDEEINLLDLLRVLRRRWWVVALVTLLGTGGAVYYARHATPIYRAQAVIAPPEQKKAGAASAALSALGGFGAEVAGSLGVSIGAADANRLEALLKSHRLIERTVTKHNLLPVLFAGRWDVKANQWNTAEGDPAPNVWDAHKFLRRVFVVRNDAKAGTLTLSLEFRDPEIAKKMLQHFLGELALMMQEDELRKIESNKRFVQEQLQRTADPMVVAKLQTLLSEQLEKAMMARNVENVAFELIDPADGSNDPVKPKRGQIAAIGLVASLVSGVLFAFVSDWTARPRAGRAWDPEQREG